MIADARIEAIVDFLAEIEKLKLVCRRAYVSDRSRHENSAEHSWHLALALLIVARESNLDIDVTKALKLALVHDLGEIDAGDVSIFDANRAAKIADEQSCISRLAQYDIEFAGEMAALWREYEAQQTVEAKWVGVLDRFMPFIVNLTTEGQTWRDQNISRSQVLAINHAIRERAPELFRWMTRKIDESVRKGWLRDE